MVFITRASCSPVSGSRLTIIQRTSRAVTVTAGPESLVPEDQRATNPTILEKRCAVAGLKHDVGSEAPAIEFESRLDTDAGNGRQADHRYWGIIEDPVLELHEFDVAPKTLGDLALEVCAAKIQLPARRCAHVSRKGFACTLVETQRVVQKEFSDAACGKPWKAAVISYAPEGEAPITVETVPSEKCRLGYRACHRFDGVPNKFVNMSEFIRHTQFPFLVHTRSGGRRRRKSLNKHAPEHPMRITDKGACFRQR